MENLNRPEGNITGVEFYVAKPSTPSSSRYCVIWSQRYCLRRVGESTYPPFEAVLPDVEAAGRALGRQIVVAKVSKEHEEFEAAFEKFVQAGVGALLVSGSAFLTSKRKALIELAVRHAIPAIYDQRRIVLDGGLISYAASFNGAYRQAGIYAGRILKGAKPSELPVLKPTQFVLAINLKTANALGLDVPPSILLRADEVIE